MSTNYARNLAKDESGQPMQNHNAPLKALAISSSTNVSVSSVITVTDNTTALEVATVGGPAVLRWVPSTDTAASVIASGAGANYDHVIPTNMYRRLVIPQERAGVSSIVGRNVQAGLYKRYAIIGAGGPSSVLTAEF